MYVPEEETMSRFISVCILLVPLLTNSFTKFENFSRFFFFINLVWISFSKNILPSLSLSHSLRAHAGDGLRLLEDGVAGEHGSYRHGDQPGGSGQGRHQLQIPYNRRSQIRLPCPESTDSLIVSQGKRSHPFFFFVVVVCLFGHQCPDVSVCVCVRRLSEAWVSRAASSFSIYLISEKWEETDWWPSLPERHPGNWLLFHLSGSITGDYTPAVAASFYQAPLSEQKRLLMLSSLDKRRLSLSGEDGW